tara:strand:+ start:541 stop:702 length:162 start_codon:yes stop_codon:yes gene_type:complete
MLIGISESFVLRSALDASLAVAVAQCGPNGATLGAIVARIRIADLYLHNLPRR